MHLSGTEDETARSGGMKELHELVSGTGFRLTGRLEDGRVLGLWGGGSVGTYEGREDGMEVDGDVLALGLGHDVSGTLSGGPGRRWLAGAMVSRHSGDGNWALGGVHGDADNTLTTVVPYAAVDVSGSLRLWGSLGWGEGRQTVADSARGGVRREDTRWRMAAGGFRRDLDWFAVEPAGRSPLVPGLELSLNGDFRRTRVSSSGVSGKAGRVRLGLEGSVVRELGDGSVIRPVVEVGVRHDSGDAETGTGVELAGGVTWRDARGLEMVLEGRTVALHGDGDYRDHGLSASVSWDPAPGRVGSVSFRLGFVTSAGLDIADSAGSMDGASGGGDDGRTWDAGLSYGLREHGGGLLGGPYLGLSGDGGLGETRVGYRVGPHGSGDGPELDLFTRLDRAGDAEGAGDFGAGLEFRWNW